MSRLKHLVKSMEPQIGQRSCKLIWDSSCGLVNRRAPKKTVSFVSRKTVTFGNKAKKPHTSLVAERISFFEDGKTEDCKVRNKRKNVLCTFSVYINLSFRKSE